MPDLRRARDANQSYLRAYRAIWRYSLPTVFAALAVILLFVEHSVVSGLVLMGMAVFFVPVIRTFRKRLPSVCNTLILVGLVAAFYFSMYLYV